MLTCLKVNAFSINFMLRVSVRAMHKQRGKKKKQAYQLHGAWFSDNTFSEPWKANVASNLILLILDHIEKILQCTRMKLKYNWESAPLKI